MQCQYGQVMESLMLGTLHLDPFLFPARAGTMASIHQTYELVRCVLHYEPFVGPMFNGALLIGYDPDVDAPEPISGQVAGGVAIAIGNMTNSVSTKVNTALSWDLSTAKAWKSGPRFCNPRSSDERLCAYGKLLIAMTGVDQASVKALGQIKIEYHFIFSGQVVPSVLPKELDYTQTSNPALVGGDAGFWPLDVQMTPDAENIPEDLETVVVAGWHRAFRVRPGTDLLLKQSVQMTPNYPGYAQCSCRLQMLAYDPGSGHQWWLPVEPGLTPHVMGSTTAEGYGTGSTQVLVTGAFHVQNGVDHDVFITPWATTVSFTDSGMATGYVAALLTHIACAVLRGICETVLKIVPGHVALWRDMNWEGWPKDSSDLDVVAHTSSDPVRDTLASWVGYNRTRPKRYDYTMPAPSSAFRPDLIAIYREKYASHDPLVEGRELISDATSAPADAALADIDRLVFPALSPTTASTSVVGRGAAAAAPATPSVASRR